jgi:hypothetical protein
MSPAPVSPAPRMPFMQAINEDNGAGFRKDLALFSSAGIPTAAGPTDLYLLAPEDGNLHSVEFSTSAALAPNATNYVTFTLVNLGQDGLGVMNMLEASLRNNTQIGGANIVANSRLVLPVSALKGALVVKAGDRLKFTTTVTGTLGGALPNVNVLFRFAS